MAATKAHSPVAARNDRVQKKKKESRNIVQLIFASATILENRSTVQWLSSTPNKLYKVLKVFQNHNLGGN